jgi:putative hemolysin
VRVVGGDPAKDRQAVTEQEIRDLIAAQPSYTEEQRRIIDGALEVADRTLRQIVVPRSQVVALPDHLDVEEAVRRLSAAGHSRAPVYREQLDDAGRTVSVLGLVGRHGAIADHARPALALPESLDAVIALRELQSSRQQLALVVSEHGGVDGIITVEDLVEELVGEIYDEHDRDVQTVERRDDGSIVLPGTFPLHDLVDLDLEVDAAADATTIGGLVLDELGRLPQPGDVVPLPGLEIEVLGVRRRTPERVRIFRSTGAADGATNRSHDPGSPSGAA